MRKIKELTFKDIKAYSKIAYMAYPSFKDFSNEGLIRYYSGIEDSLENDKAVHFYGMFENDELVGVMRLFDFKMNYFNEMIDSSGLGFLGVDLLHKKEKIALDMIKFYEKLYLSQNKPIATLLPFRPDFYKPMGYGFGTKINQYRISPKHIPSFNIKSNLKFIKTPEDIDKLLNFHEKLCHTKHGMIMKIYDEISELKEDNYTQILASFDKDKEINGYMTFEFQNDKPGNLFVNNIYIKDLEYIDPDILKVFLDFLNKQSDEIRLVIFNTKDKYFHHLFNNPLNDSDNYIPFGNIESNSQAVGIMYKLLDIYMAFEQNKHRNFNFMTLTIGLNIIDDYDENIKHYILDFEGGVYTGRNKKPDVEMTLKLSDFSSLFMGAISVKSLYNLGLLKLDSNAYLQMLDYGFYSPTKPICNTDF